jgi:hypothetical protein
MSDTLTFAELDAQQVELLPARTVLSLFSVSGGKGGDGGKGGAGGSGTGGLGVNAGNVNIFGGQLNSAGNGFGGDGGSANGGHGGNVHIHHKY